MEVTMKETRVSFHANRGAVRKVDLYDGHNVREPFVAVTMLDGEANDMTVYLDLGQAREIADRLTALLPPAKYLPTDEGEVECGGPHV